MKRRNTSSMFLFGLIQTAFRYIFILLTGFVFLVIGFFGFEIFKSFGVAAIIFYLLLCFVEQLKIHSMSHKQRDNQDFSKFMDSILGIRNHDETNPSSFEELKKERVDDEDNDYEQKRRL